MLGKPGLPGKLIKQADKYDASIPKAMTGEGPSSMYRILPDILGSITYGSTLSLHHGLNTHHIRKYLGGNIRQDRLIMS